MSGRDTSGLKQTLLNDSHDVWHLSASATCLLPSKAFGWIAESLTTLMIWSLCAWWSSEAAGFVHLNFDVILEL